LAGVPVPRLAGVTKGPARNRFVDCPTDDDEPAWPWGVIVSWVMPGWSFTFDRLYRYTVVRTLSPRNTSMMRP
jgi:hypothetical protein